MILLACRGTQSAQYIGSGCYELDESQSNQAVNPKSFRALVEDGKIFEVTILIHTANLILGVCPRCRAECGAQEDAGDAKWTRW